MYPDLASQSRQLHMRAEHVMPGGNTRTTVYISPYPIYATHGAGCRVYDADGNEFIDCINNFTALIHGHAHPVVVAAARKQMEMGTAFGMPTESEILLAELLVGRVPGIERIRFANSGTEAVMMALKAARAFTGRPKIAKIEGAYHGSYDYAEISLDAGPDNWGRDTPTPVAYAHGTPPNVLTDVLVLPYNDVMTTEGILRANAESLAGVIIDLIPNRVGLVPATQEYVSMLRRVTAELGILLIIDEVITLRLAAGGAQTLFNVLPDITVVGKIMGGGFPIGGIGGRADVMEVFDPTSGKPALPHGGTFSANPMSMVAGRVAMELLDSDAYARLNRQGDFLRASLNRAFSDCGVEGQVTGMGSLARVHFKNGLIRNYRDAYPTVEQKKLLGLFYREMINLGVLMASYGLMALSTPMQDDDIEQIIQATHTALNSMRRKGVL
jgi:glutamate-1-semialdehyde 2,1-aminomutase